MCYAGLTPELHSQHTHAESLLCVAVTKNGRVIAAGGTVLLVHTLWLGLSALCLIVTDIEVICVYLSPELTVQLSNPCCLQVALAGP